MRVPVGDKMTNCGQAVSDCVLGNHFAIYANAFTKRDEMRGGKEAGAIALRATDRIDRRTDRAFAICACDVNDVSSAKIHIQLCKESPDVFQAKLDAEALEAVQPGERLFVS